MLALFARLFVYATPWQLGAAAPSPGETVTKPRLVAVTAALAMSLGLMTGTASAQTTAPTYYCFNGINKVQLQGSWTGLDNAKLVFGGAPVESTFTLTNTSGHDLPGVTIWAQWLHDQELAWHTFTIETKETGGDWKNLRVSQPLMSGSGLSYGPLGPLDLAKGATLTVRFRFSVPLVDTGVMNAPMANHYKFALAVSSELFDNDSGKFLDPNAAVDPTPGPTGVCTSYVFAPTASFDTVAASSPTPTPTASTTATTSVAPTGTPTTTAEPAATGKPAPTSSATPTATAKPSPSPTATGPELAFTGGGGSALPFGIGGAAVVVLGGAILVAVRRRKRAHN
ncbi:hypothetical protein [Kitasatospora sp. LaBMicrA B282]|uniref:hypothetical protein n=1 Tax=Kitasatospora sp. LaBMicrA B282 TaxID=3420949 RepID=UPI003D0E1421